MGHFIQKHLNPRLQLHTEDAYALRDTGHALMHAKR